jgi:hypothetical protein
MMTKVVISIMVLAVFVTTRVLADPSDPHLNWGSQVNAGQCDKTGKPVLNVSGKVANDVDSGQGGNYWAFDDFNRQIQVWAQSDGSYCAVVRIEGNLTGRRDKPAPAQLERFLAQKMAALKAAIARSSREL